MAPIPFLKTNFCSFIRQRKKNTYDNVNQARPDSDYFTVHFIAHHYLQPQTDPPSSL